jgi:arylsulfatase A-like enzyme
MNRLSAFVYGLSIGFWCLTSGYALLASQAFAYEQFLEPRLLPPLAGFAAWHPWINGVVYGLVCLVRWPALRSAARPATLWLLGAWGATSVLLLGLPPLASLTPGPPARLFATLALVPVAWILWAEWSAVPRRGPDATPAEVPPHAIANDWCACVVAGAFSACLYTGVAQIVSADAGALSGPIAAAGFLETLVLHELLFLAVFCALTVLRGMARFFVAFPHRAEMVLATVALAALVVGAVHTVVLPGLSLIGPVEKAIGVGFGLALALAIAVRGVNGSEPDCDGVSRILRPLVPKAVDRSVPATALWLALLGALALVLAWGARQMDWNGIVSRLAVMTVWVLVLATCMRSIRPGLATSPAVLYGASVAVLGVHVALVGPLAAEPEGRVGIDADPSFRMLHGWLEPPARADAALFSLLQQHTNISRKLSIAPVDLTLAPLDGPPAAYRPHVFVFVVDSLRRDYLSPYNPAVHFSPAIGRFASESSVFRHAFTRYGATGLSVPALWSGAPLLHKQYVTPFAPMNTLAKLVEHEGYAQWIGMDNVLDVILPPSDAREPLDASVMVKDFRFCRTLSELRGRLETRPADAAPVFAYTLPQDIHVSVVTREGASQIDDADYSGFSAPVASRIRRFDACFGSFIDFLREQGLYDDSLIVLTSDHGDSLGEEGRVGHAYGLFPEVIRIPMIVHLPKRLRGVVVADLEAPVYNTDVTPTLYRLLGHEREASSDLFGRSLFHASGEGGLGRDRGVMVASSYGAVYGALLDAATRLYIVDTVNVKEYAYAMQPGEPAVAIPVDANLRGRGQVTIRETIQSLADLHDYRPGS